MQNKFAAITFLFFQAIQAIQVVSANDDIGDIDKARAFPIQKNNTVIHSSSNSEGDVTKNQTSPSSTAVNSTQPKDTSLIINGNGGSTNRSAGGSATIRKRFTFD